jgi:pimeloyl-ACP methyl ester carboxylesterase
MRGEFIDTGGVRIYCYAAGSRGAGLPLLLLTGPPFNSALWEPLLRELPSGHRTLVVDPLGTGRSDPPLPGRASPSDHATALCTLLRTMGITRLAVAAHGTGAAIAAAMLQQHPDCVDRVALLAPVLDGHIVGGGAARLSAFAPELIIAARLRAAVTSAYADRERGARSAAALLHSGLRHWATHAAAFAAPAPYSPAWPAPTLVVSGTDDPVAAHDRSAALAAHLGAQFVSIPGAAHALPEEFPGTLAPHLATWLAA